MHFLNDPVNVDLLPKMEDTELKPINRSYLTVLRIELFITSFIVAVIAAGCLYFISNLHKPVWILGIPSAWLVLMVGQYIVQQRSFAITAYAVRDKDIIYRSGWIFRSVHICPFNRIQHSSVDAGPIERKFKLATLVLYTAGANDSDLRIHGLHLEQALTLKEWINKKVTDEEIP